MSHPVSVGIIDGFNEEVIFELNFDDFLMKDIKEIEGRTFQ